MSMNKNIQGQNSESSFLHELEKQENAFRIFLASLKKCPNKDFNQPEVSKSQIKQSSQITKPAKVPSSNFRISFKLPSEKQKAFKKDDINKSLNPSSQRKFHESKEPSKQSSEITHKNRLLSQRYQESSRKKRDMSLANDLKNQFKTAQNFRSLGQSKLKIQQISSVTWNPDSRDFMTKLYHKNNNENPGQLSAFLLQILNMNVSSMIDFFHQEAETLVNLNQIQGKAIYDLFQQIFDLQKFRPIKDPLIKRYNNCIFYGEKTNFDSIHSGIILYFNGNAYFGSLKNFQKHGLGIDFVQAKNLPSKTFRQTENPSDYVIYRGNFYKNSKSGQFLIHAQDYVYQGLIVKGFFEGNGTLITANSVFKGLWSLNKKVSGSQTFKNHPMAYEGEYLDDKFHGRGKLKNSDQFYEGQFKNGLKHGQGILVNKKMIYEGAFQNDKKHGSGIIFDKSEYSQLNPESENKEIDFQACIYKVQFEDDEMISKVELKNKNLFDEQSLKTLEEENSVEEKVTIDFENIRPSKMLNSFEKDKLPEKEKHINNQQESKKISQFLSVLPKEPEEQLLHSQRKNTYLLGNGLSRFPAKTRREMD